jgi:hypothetical protein
MKDVVVLQSWTEDANTLNADGGGKERLLVNGAINGYTEG